MACRAARGCSATGVCSCSVLCSPERQIQEHEEQQLLGWTRTAPHSRILLPPWLQHDAQELRVSCCTCMGWSQWLSQKQNTCSSWELGILRHIHTVSPQNPSVSNPWKDRMPPHGNTSLPGKSSPTFSGHGEAKGRWRININTYWQSRGEEKEQRASPLALSSLALLSLLLVLSNTDENAALLPPRAAFCRDL